MKTKQEYRHEALSRLERNNFANSYSSIHELPLFMQEN